MAVAKGMDYYNQGNQLENVSEQSQEYMQRQQTVTSGGLRSFTEDESHFLQGNEDSAVLHSSALRENDGGNSSSYLLRQSLCSSKGAKSLRKRVGDPRQSNMYHSTVVAAADSHCLHDHAHSGIQNGSNFRSF